MLVPTLALTPLLSRFLERRFGIAVDLNASQQEGNLGSAEKLRVSSDRLSTGS